MKQKAQTGFTLIELMVTVALAAVLVTIGLPAMGDFVRNSRLTATVNDFIAATTIARSEAVKRRTPVTVCASDDSLASSPACDKGAGTVWEDGWLVFVDADGDAVVDTGEEILQRQGPLTEQLSIRANAALTEYVSFSGVGETRSTAGASVTGSLVFCDDRGVVAGEAGLSTARGVNVSRTGRPESLREQDAVAALGISCP